MNSTEIEQEGAKRLLDDIKNGVIPQMLYKYRTLKSAKKFLENGKMFFSRSSEFNDPFEGKFIINIPPINEKGKQKIKQQYDNALAEIGILCLGEIPDNILMWSHYTDKHKGVCLGFDITKDRDFFACAIPVDYSEEYPRYSFPPDRFFSCLSRKLITWRHEKEVRILKPGFYGLREVKKEALTHVYFGVNTSKEEVERIKKMAVNKGWNPKFVKCFLSAGEFKLGLKEL
jgi:hypothetical protein